MPLRAIIDTNVFLSALWSTRGAAIEVFAELRRGLEIFGLGSLGTSVEPPAEIVALARARLDARGARDFVESDRLRDEIARAGWDVRDGAGGFELVPLP